jgi:site-specific recombinase XerD
VAGCILVGVTPTVAEAAESYLRARAARHELAPDSLRTYRESLTSLCHALGSDTPLEDVEREDIDGWAETQADLSPNTVRVRTTAVRGLFAWAIDEDLLAADPSRSLRPPRKTRSVPRALSPAHVAAILTGCRDDTERLVVLLMAQEAMRRGEVARLSPEDIDAVERTALVRGKGGHERLVPISDETWTLIDLVAELPRTPRAVGDLVAGVMARAGVRSSGHALRHTALTDMYEHGADVREVQAMAGHQSLATTDVYLRRVSMARLRSAAGGRRYGGEA